MEEGDLLVLDVGVEYRHYTADITRTLPVSGSFTEEQAEIYDIVLEAQRRAIDQIKPGALYREDIESAARDYIEEEGFGDYFIHGTGHFVGLDVHDVGDYEIPLEPGVILTIEPGIYIPDKGIGVRIEDMILVTENGHEILSRGIPKSRVEIEEAMREPASTLPSSQP
jgi:Xaa-Pro aminopeptidase